MSKKLEKTTLMKYLESKDVSYYAKVLELQREVRGWLAYVPETFPHYTRHTVEHSEEIVLQASKLLFKDDNYLKPVIELSAAEAYVLAAAAFLHDAGMVVAEKEKLEILSSDAWRKWTTDGGGAKRWLEIQNLRQSKKPADEVVRNYLADLQTRFLVAEFVRRVHHLRAAKVIEQHQSMLGRFAFDNPMLQNTIADVCVAHGLRQHELEDNVRYPERRDIDGQTVNVRLIAILLRLGDLLDVSHDRACPLLLNAASPLPADSLAHWNQYRRITHRLTSPDSIEITAECHTQEEHRVLQDWCQWIVEEVNNAKVLMIHAARHSDWQPPEVGFDGADPTIDIHPAPTASYFPSKWTFELDHEAVFQRLIYDVYDSPASFIRELIQNALDANRCQMYADLLAEHIEPPAYPTQVQEERRQRYPVRISLGTKEVENSLSGEVETKQVLTVEDCGIGMDKDIIQRYFLQVGRSYYITDEFRRKYRFIPTSRFGVGFLSVFAVSDNVTVETHKPTSPANDGPLRLTLTGPRNYLLTEHSDHHANGTRIEILLREPMQQGELTKLVDGWCRRVEFPVIVDDMGMNTTITAERPEQFVYEIPDVTEEGAKLAVRAFPINRPGIEGEFYVFVRINNKGESWTDRYWAMNEYPKMHPQAVQPELPESITCIHGIVTEISSRLPIGYISPMRIRLDYRSNDHELPISRNAITRRSNVLDNYDSALVSRLEELLSAHLNNSSCAISQEGWKYKQSLIEYFPLPTFWAAFPQTIRYFQNGEPYLASLNEIQSMPTFTVTLLSNKNNRLSPKSKEGKPLRHDMEVSGPVILEEDIRRLSDNHKENIFKARSVKNLRWLSNRGLLIDWEQSTDDDQTVPTYSADSLILASIPNSQIIGLNIASYDTRVNLLNSDHPFTKWLLLIKDTCMASDHGTKEAQYKQLISLVMDNIKFSGGFVDKLQNYLDAWVDMPHIPQELYPPGIKLTNEMFMPLFPEQPRRKHNSKKKPGKRKPSARRPKRVD